MIFARPRLSPAPGKNPAKKHSGSIDTPGSSPGLIKKNPVQGSFFRTCGFSLSCFEIPGIKSLVIVRVFVAYLEINDCDVAGWKYKLMRLCCGRA